MHKEKTSFITEKTVYNVDMQYKWTLCFPFSVQWYSVLLTTTKTENTRKIPLDVN